MKRLCVIFILIFLACGSCFAAVEKNQTLFVQDPEYKNITNQANVLYAQNDIKQAMELFTSIPESERTPQNWLLMGNILQDQGKEQDAIFMYNKAIFLDDNFYKAHYNLGNIYLSNDQTNLAIEKFKKVIKIKPNYAYAHYNLACAYIKLEKYSKARFELFTAIELKNNVPDFYYNLAYVYKKMKKEKDAKIYLDKYNKLMENDNVQGYNF